MANNNNSATTAPATTAPATTAPEVPKRELLAKHSPAAKIAYDKGEETKRIVITPNFPEERFRSVSVNDNPSCLLPVDEEVEVALDEYNELKRVALIRKRNKNESDKLEREFRDRKKYF